jgi:Tol biopolymer transport system component
MGKQACIVLLCLVAAAILASCSPTAGTTDTPESGSTRPPASTPEPVGAPAACQGRMTFVGRADGEQDLFVINADGSGLTNITNGGGPEDSPSWSPDGTRIVFSRHVGNSDIYTIHPDGSELVRLTDEPSREYAPSWSPDGQQVIFGSTRGYATELLVVSAEGGAAMPLTDNSAHKPDFAWSPAGAPGGERIAFTMLDGYNQGDIFVMAAPDETGAGGSVPNNLTQHPAHDCCVDWAPDGGRLLFLSSRSDKGAGQGYRFITLLVRADPDSDLTASSGVVRPVTTVMPEQPRDIYVIRSDGSELTRVTDGVGHARQATWSPDGKSIAFVSDRDDNDEIYVMFLGEGPGAAGGESFRLTDSPEDNLHPTWSPDGQCLAFVSYDDGESALYVMNADGSGQTRLAEDIVWSRGPSWSP